MAIRFQSPNVSHHTPTTEVGRQVAEDLSQARDRKVSRGQVEQQLSAMGTAAAERTLVRDIAEAVATQGHALEAADVQFIVESLRDGTLPSQLRAQFKVTETAGRRPGRPDAMPVTSEYQPSEGSGVHFRPKHDKPPTAEETLERALEKADIAADDPLRESARRTWKRLLGLGGGVDPGLVVRSLKRGQSSDAVVRLLTEG